MTCPEAATCSATAAFSSPLELQLSIPATGPPAPANTTHGRTAQCHRRRRRTATVPYRMVAASLDLAGACTYSRRRCPANSQYPIRLYVHPGRHKNREKHSGGAFAQQQPVDPPQAPPPAGRRKRWIDAWPLLTGMQVAGDPGPSGARSCVHAAWMRTNKSQSNYRG